MALMLNGILMRVMKPEREKKRKREKSKKSDVFNNYRLRGNSMALHCKFMHFENMHLK